MTKKLSRKLFGVTFEEGKVYVVKDKTTRYSTPEEKKKGFFKDPHEGVHESHQIGFKEIGDQRGADGIPLGTFLTGFTVDCPIWQTLGVDDRTKQEIVKFLQEFIVTPYENKLGLKGHLSPSNYLFWRGYRYLMHTGSIFNLDLVEHRMALYFALLNGNIATQENLSNPTLIETPYKIEDYSLAKDEQEELLDKKDDARTYLGDLLENDFTYLLSIMKYMSLFSADTTPDKDYVRKTFLKILEGMDLKTSMSQLFQVFDMAQTMEGKSKIEWTARVKDLRTFNILVIANKTWRFQGTALGVTIDDVIYKLSGADETFDDFIRDEILSRLQEEYAKRKGYQAPVFSEKKEKVNKVTPKKKTKKKTASTKKEGSSKDTPVSI